MRDDDSYLARIIQLPQTVVRNRALTRYRSTWGKQVNLDDAVLLEPQQGRSPFGNVFYVLKELVSNARYAHLKLLYVYEVGKRKLFESAFIRYGFSNVELIERSSARYLDALGNARYLITDTSFDTRFTKLEGQVVWNLWHGTPLKTMGRFSADDCHQLGNVQRNLYLADFISCPSEYVADVLVSSYMVENLAQGTKLLFAGYPRNTALLDSEGANAAHKLLTESVSSGASSMNVRRIYMYMPTWRSWSGNGPSPLSCHIGQIDGLLRDDELLVLNIHPLEQLSVDVDSLHHVVMAPGDIETYEVLSACDALITDYSSVLFDYAVTGKKIVLFDYDREAYLAERGMLLDYEGLPFSKAQTVEALIDCLRDEKPSSCSEFVERFCSYESLDATSDLCARVFFGEHTVEEREIEGNGKPNVLMYVGNLANNGITASLRNLMNSGFSEERNVFLTFTSEAVEPNKAVLADLPEHVLYAPQYEANAFTLPERLVRKLYMRHKIGFDMFDRTMGGVYERELYRRFGQARFDEIIHFTSYDREWVYLLGRACSPSAIFAHNDLVREYETKRNVDLDLLRDAYERYGTVAVVSGDLVPMARQIGGDSIDAKVVPNLFDYERIRRLAGESLDTITCERSSRPLDEVLDMFGPDAKAIVSIGRFAPEKQHGLLIKAFDSLYVGHPEARLVIIGGYSHKDTYERTLELLQSLSCRDAVALVMGMRNPYALLARAQGFILSSSYEGQGLVLLEADTLGIPAVSTDVTGPHAFMTEHGGTLVDNSFEGICQGLTDLIEERVSTMSVDYDRYNADVLEAYKTLLASKG